MDGIVICQWTQDRRPNEGNGLPIFKKAKFFDKESIADIVERQFFVSVQLHESISHVVGFKKDVDDAIDKLNFYEREYRTEFLTEMEADKIWKLSLFKDSIDKFAVAYHVDMEYYS